MKPVQKSNRFAASVCSLFLAVTGMAVFGIPASAAAAPSASIVQVKLQVRKYYPRCNHFHGGEAKVRVKTTLLDQPYSNARRVGTLPAGTGIDLCESANGYIGL